MQLSLFDNAASEPSWQEELIKDVLILRRFALANDELILTAIESVVAQAPFRQMYTPGGYLMSAKLTACGEFGWVTDLRGYRYERFSPETGQAWPAMPSVLQTLANRAATKAGYEQFSPDTCLINQYKPSAKMSLHQDKNEQDFSQPIVSVSLGVSATFQMGGASRNDPTVRTQLEHGDVMVWGRSARRHFHGISPLKAQQHALLGEQRINLTFRQAM